MRVMIPTQRVVTMRDGKRVSFKPNVAAEFSDEEIDTLAAHKGLLREPINEAARVARSPNSSAKQPAVSADAKPAQPTKNDGKTAKPADKAKAAKDDDDL